MPEILIVSKTKMHDGCCVSGIEITTGRALRLIPPGEHNQPENTKLQIGQVWEGTFKMRGTPAPFVEDADAVLTQMLRKQNVATFVAGKLKVASGSTDVIYNSKLHWNPGRKGYLEPGDPTSYSTQFWRPDSTLRLYDRDTKPIFWEPESKRRIPWVGVAAPPDFIPAGSLSRVSLGRPYTGNLDHKVCWLQLSGVY